MGLINGQVTFQAQSLEEWLGWVNDILPSLPETIVVTLRDDDLMKLAVTLTDAS